MDRLLHDDTLDRLGRYFVAARIREFKGITFEQFLELYLSGMWPADAVMIQWPLDVKAATEYVTQEAV